MKSDPQIEEKQNVVSPSTVDLKCREISDQNKKLFTFPAFTSESLLKCVCEMVRASSASVGDRR
jgi:hypothetical protein